MTVRAYSLRLVKGSSQGIYESHLTTALEGFGVETVDSPTEADIIHQYDTNLLASKFSGVGDVIQAAYSATPLIVAVDDLFFLDEPQLTRYPQLYPVNARLHKMLLKMADSVITFSEHAAENIRGNSKQNQIHVIPHGISDDFRCQSLENDGYVLHVGHAAPYKYPEAVAMVACNCDFPFKIVGNNWESYIPPEVRQRANVDVVGYMPRSELRELYKSAYAFYYPTRTDSFGLPLLEALATSTPVVTVRAGAAPEVVGDVGIVEEPDDFCAHLQQLRDLLDEKERRSHIAALSYRRALDFSWRRAARQTLSVYKKAIMN